MPGEETGRTAARRATSKTGEGMMMRRGSDASRDDRGPGGGRDAHRGEVHNAVGNGAREPVGPRERLREGGGGGARRVMGVG